MAKFKKGQPQRFERVITQADRERIWELYFGKKLSLNRIAEEYGVHYSSIALAIDTESACRWKKNHPNETNKERLE